MKTTQDRRTQVGGTPSQKSNIQKPLPGSSRTGSADPTQPGKAPQTPRPRPPPPPRRHTIPSQYDIPKKKWPPEHAVAVPVSLEPGWENVWKTQGEKAKSGSSNAPNPREQNGGEGAPGGGASGSKNNQGAGGKTQSQAKTNTGGSSNTPDPRGQAGDHGSRCHGGLSCTIQ